MTIREHVEERILYNSKEIEKISKGIVEETQTDYVTKLLGVGRIIGKVQENAFLAQLREEIENV